MLTLKLLLLHLAALANATAELESSRKLSVAIPAKKHRGLIAALQVTDIAK
jgi:hypothetical protein